MTSTVLVTGANRGIGLEFCKLYKQQGHQVIGVCRKKSPDLEALGVEIIDGIDVTNQNNLDALKQKLSGRTIDILINNAGLLCQESLDNMNWEQIQRQFEVNTLGPLRVTHTLLDNLKEGSKVALITSRMGSIQDNGSGGNYGYRMSKAALNAAGKSLALDLKPRKIAVALLHPGYVQTEMTGFTGDIKPDEAASRLVQRIEGLNLENSGSFWHSNGELLPW